MKGCELCETIDWRGMDKYKIVTCETCKVDMIVLKEHRQFTEFERELISQLWGIKELWGKKVGYKLRWEQQKIKDHAHVHLMPRGE